MTDEIQTPDRTKLSPEAFDNPVGFCQLLMKIHERMEAEQNKDGVSA